MIKDMYAVMNRISDIKKRFGVMRHNEKTSPEKTEASFQKTLDAVQKSSNSQDKISAVDSRAKINNLVDRYSAQNRISPELVKAVITQESGYNSKAVSPKGAKGLMQLMPTVLRSMNVQDPFAPDENIRAGVGYLKGLLDKYHGDYKKALAAYNAGPGAVDREGGVPEYKETKEYVQKVISSYLENK